MSSITTTIPNSPLRTRTSSSGRTLIQEHKIYVGHSISLDHMFKGHVEGYVLNYQCPWLTIKRGIITRVITSKIKNSKLKFQF